jgi:hypothetical protein
VSLSFAQGVALPPFLLAATPSESAYHCHGQNASAPYLPPLPPRESKSVRTGAISISSASSPQCHLTSSAASSSTIPDVLHARLYCSLGRSTCSRLIATSLASRVTSLHIVVLHAVQLLLRFLLPNPCSPGLAASLPRSHTRSSAARATCPPAAQRLYSSALRAARSRTHRHVALHQLPFATARTPSPCTASSCACRCARLPRARICLGRLSRCRSASRAPLLLRPSRSSLAQCTSATPLCRPGPRPNACTTSHPRCVARHPLAPLHPRGVHPLLPRTYAPPAPACCSPPPGTAWPLLALLPRPEPSRGQRPLRAAPAVCRCPRQEPRPLAASAPPLASRPLPRHALARARHSTHLRAAGPCSALARSAWSCGAARAPVAPASALASPRLVRSPSAPPLQPLGSPTTRARARSRPRTDPAAASRAEVPCPAWCLIWIERGG